jgi:hypothetical protein
VQPHDQVQRLERRRGTEQAVRVLIAWRLKSATMGPVSEHLESILVEEAHLDCIEAQLDQINQIGLENYLTNQTWCAAGYYSGGRLRLATASPIIAGRRCTILRDGKWMEIVVTLGMQPIAPTSQPGN